jgi:hypothetical protein
MEIEPLRIKVKWGNEHSSREEIACILWLETEPGHPAFNTQVLLLGSTQAENFILKMLSYLPKPAYHIYIVLILSIV